MLFRPVKSDDFGGAFFPLAGKLFCVTENISGNAKHSLLCPEHKMFLGHEGQSAVRAVPVSHRPIRRGTSGEAGIGSRDKDTALFNLLYPSA